MTGSIEVITCFCNLLLEGDISHELYMGWFVDNFVDFVLFLQHDMCSRNQIWNTRLKQYPYLLRHLYRPIICLFGVFSPLVIVAAAAVFHPVGLS